MGLAKGAASIRLVTSHGSRPVRPRNLLDVSSHGNPERCLGGTDSGLGYAHGRVAGDRMRYLL